MLDGYHSSSLQIVFYNVLDDPVSFLADAGGGLIHEKNHGLLNQGSRYADLLPLA